MKYKGKELIEMLPENWDGKSRNMLVWCDDTKPIHRIVCGYDPIHCVWLVAETQAVWKHCAEIPKEPETKNSIDDCIVTFESFIDGSSNSDWRDLYRDIVTYLNYLKDLKEENKALKAKIEPEKKLRRMTYKELDDWLEQGKGVVKIGDKVRDTISYDCESRNQEVSGYYKICGYDEDTWHYPMIEV